MTFNIGTPVGFQDNERCHGAVGYGVVTAMGEGTLTIREDDDSMRVIDVSDDVWEDVVWHRSLTINRVEHYFDVDASGTMTLWRGHLDDAFPMPVGTVDTMGADVWLHLWAMSD